MRKYMIAAAALAMVAPAAASATATTTDANYTTTTYQEEEEDGFPWGLLGLLGLLGLIPRKREPDVHIDARHRDTSTTTGTRTDTRL
ncbi:MAG TPA: WGxxGxxG family protein [Allosphingosinicella sp.]|uniref:WGxxGxxG family protein n=1 Tax=Allosphingosinicella sp. TaxID=2823234 RepID=UPI002EDA7F46